MRKRWNNESAIAGSQSRVVFFALAALFLISSLTGCVNRCRGIFAECPSQRCAECYGYVASSSIATRDNYSIAGSNAQQAWSGAQELHPDVSPLFVLGWQKGYAWAENRQLEARLTDTDELPLSSGNSISQPQWQVGCRAGINYYVDSLIVENQIESRPAYVPSLSAALIQSEPEKITNISATKSSSMETAPPAPIEILKTDSTPTDESIGAPEVLNPNEGLDPLTGQSTNTPLETTRRDDVVPSTPEMAETQKVDDIRPQTAENRAPNTPDVPPLQSPDSSNEPTVADEPIASEKLAEQMEVLEQIQSAMQAEPQVYKTEPTIDWEPIANNADANSPSNGDDSLFEKAGDSAELNAGELEKSDETNETTPSPGSMPAEHDHPQNLRPVDDEFEHDAKPLPNSKLPVDQNSAELFPEEVFDGPMLRLIARPISGLIHGRGGALKVPSASSKAKFIQEPIFVPPSAVESLPASELPSPPPEDIRRLKTMPESVIDPRQASPPKDHALR